MADEERRRCRDWLLRFLGDAPVGAIPLRQITAPDYARRKTMRMGALILRRRTLLLQRMAPLIRRLAYECDGVWNDALLEDDEFLVRHPEFKKLAPLKVT
jgi:hypothetical protein